MRKSTSFVVERKRSFVRVPPPAPKTHTRRYSYLAPEIENDDLEPSVPVPETAPEIVQPAPRILPNLLAVDPLDEKLKAAKTRRQKATPPVEAKQAKPKPAKIARLDAAPAGKSPIASSPETSPPLEKRIPRAKGDLPAGERWKRRLRHLRRLH